MTDRGTLDDYKEKRDFAETPEPSTDQADNSARKIFVIQKHDSTSLHYDFRLEVDGVLKSWAVPKGPSTDPSQKRLALKTEDHPLEYADFEGVIPEDEYGGGTVLIWDRGEYENLKEEGNIGDCLSDGHATFFLKGQKLEGGYALTRTQQGDQEKWILVKMDDDKADARRNPVSTQPRSIQSDRTLDEVAEEEEA